MPNDAAEAHALACLSHTQVVVESLYLDLAVDAADDAADPHAPRPVKIKRVYAPWTPEQRARYNATRRKRRASRAKGGV